MKCFVKHFLFNKTLIYFITFFVHSFLYLASGRIVLLKEFYLLGFSVTIILTLQDQIASQFHHQEVILSRHAWKHDIIVEVSGFEPTSLRFWDEIFNHCSKTLFYLFLIIG